MDEKLNLIMPKYNQLYAIEAKNYDLLNDVDYTREGTKAGQNASQDSSQTSNSGSATSWDLYSDTPQGAITDLESNTYLTNARKVNGSNSTSENRAGTHSGSDSENYTERVHGKMGGKSYAELIMQAREAIVNIDEMIVRECNDLFMNIY